jgi:putative methylase
MKEIVSKSGLAIALSRLKGFKKPKVRAEQYMTEPEIAAEMLWLMKMRGELDDKTIADLGSGTGILGLGALLLGARKVFFVENDKEAMDIAKQNHEELARQGFMLGQAVFLLQDIKEFNKKADVVVQNPPFGTRQEHIDKAFLGVAFSIAPLVWSFHKSATERFVLNFAKDSRFRVTERIGFRFPLHAAQAFHRRRVHRIDVTLYRLEKTE